MTHIEGFKKINIIPYTPAAEQKFSELRGLKLRIGTRDLRIASIALSLGATLFSRNVSDFGKVPNLVVKDWMRL